MKIIATLFIIIINITMLQGQPQQVDFPELGLRFTIPSGWTGQQLEDRIILGHTSIPGFMVLFSNNSESLGQLKQQATMPIVEEGLYLEPEETSIVISEDKIEVFYTGRYNEASVKAFAIGLHNSVGSGMSILMVTETDAFIEQHSAEAKKLAQSVTFYNVEIPDRTEFWNNRIVGKRLKYMNTTSSRDANGGSSGISDVTNIDLCTDGTFKYYSNSQASFDIDAGFGGVNSNENTTGSYLIKSNNGSTWLLLSFMNGYVKEYELTVNDSENTFLNGSRYFITSIEGC